MNPKLVRWFHEYRAYHKDPVNNAIHKVAIPLIVFHIVAMLDWIDLAPIAELPVVGTYHLSVGHLFAWGVLVFYATLELRYAAIMGAFVLGCFAVGAVAPWWAVVAVAVGAWAAQLAGHAVWEKRSPAFFTNLLQALIGPLYYLSKALGDYPTTVESTTVEATAAESEGAAG